MRSTTQTEAAAYLLGRGCDRFATDPDGDTALFWAANLGACMTSSLHHHQRGRACGGDGAASVCRARPGAAGTTPRGLAMVTFWQDSYGQTAMHSAVVGGSARIIYLMLDQVEMCQDSRR